MGSIYKITNKITGEIYIGQTRYKVERRWYIEKWDSLNKDGHNYYTNLSKNFREYGFDNFTFEVIEKCDNDLLNERERYWIKYYNSYLEGLNMTEGGDYALIYHSIPPQMLENIYQDLRENKLTQKEIAIKYSLHKDTICGINTGRYWRKNDLDYPIRKVVSHDEKYYCKNCGQEISSKHANYCVDCSHLLQRKVVERPQPLDLAIKIVNSSFRSVAKEYNVADNTVKKWCRNYGIPYKKPELKEYVKQKCPEALKERKPVYTRDKRRVAQINPKTQEVIAIYKHTADASGKTGIHHIKEVCDGKRKSTSGYIFKYIDE